jgi:hypothetical protein
MSRTKRGDFNTILAFSYWSNSQKEVEFLNTLMGIIANSQTQLGSFMDDRQLIWALSNNHF